jgi:hypothetical protein
MWHGLGAQTLQGVEDYRELLPVAGFVVLSVEDLTDEWGVILEQRFAMYRELREETLRQGLPAGDEEFYAAYGKLVELVKARVLGGGRFAAEKPIC